MCGGLVTLNSLNVFEPPKLKSPVPVPATQILLYVLPVVSPNTRKYFADEELLVSLIVDVSGVKVTTSPLLSSTVQMLSIPVASHVPDPISTVGVFPVYA